MKPSLATALLLFTLSPLPAQDTDATEAPAKISVEGRVVDWLGAPIAGAAIGVDTSGDIVTGDVMKNPLTVTDAQGRFRIQCDPPNNDRRLAQVHVAAQGRASILQYARFEKDEDGGYKPSCDMGDLLLAEGARLFGRVRDEQGKPVPGARIVARDALAKARGLTGINNALCAAVADKSGIFSLPCALPVASHIEVTADGHFRQVIAPVSRQTPLEITLRPSGMVSGRVLDPRGSGLETSLTVRYEREASQGAIPTADDGSFRFTLLEPGRFKIQVTAPKDSGLKSKTSSVLEGPQENLELVLEAQEAESGAMLAIRCVAKATGQPVREFSVVSMWEEYANQNANYREYRLHYLAQRGTTGAKDGIARVKGPSENQPTLGCVRVLAKGYAPGTVSDYEWKEPEKGSDGDRELVVELVPESVAKGVVKDERTGAPIAGAKVMAMRQQDPQLGIYNYSNRAQDDALETGADGTFTLHGLGEGKWEIRVQHSERPNVEPLVVELGDQEEKAGLEILMPEGAVVQGKLVGARIGKGWKVYLQALPSFRGGNPVWTNTVFYSGSDSTPEGATEVAEDGTFRFQGVKLDNYMLMLLLPSPPRHGSDMRIQLEPFRVRRAGIDRQFDLGEDRPGTLRGKLSIKGADLPLDRIVVVAREQVEGQQMFFSPFNTNYPGPRSFVAPSGEFSLQVSPGKYLLEVIDVGTSMRLHGTTEPVEVAASGESVQDIEAELVAMKVKLKPAAEGKPVVADRLEVRVTSNTPNKANVGVMIGGNDNYDTGVGVPLGAGQTEVELVVPPGDVVAMVRSNVATLMENQHRSNMAPLGRAEATAAAGKPVELEIAVEHTEIEAADEEKDADKKGEKFSNPVDSGR